MTEIQRVLKKSSNSSRNDIKAFTEYSDGIITLQETKERFFKNNAVSRGDRELITDDMFLRWIKSLGY